MRTLPRMLQAPSRSVSFEGLRQPAKLFLIVQKSAPGAGLSFDAHNARGY